MATRRPTLNTNYYETFNKEHVELVDIKKEIKDLLDSEKVIASSYEGQKFDCLFALLLF